MVVLKLVISTFIVICSTKLGIEIASKYVIRENNLNEFKRDFEIIKNRIEYTYEPLDRIFSYIGNLSRSEISKVFKEASKEISYNDPKDIWKNALEKKNLSLEKEDIKILVEFADVLGKTEKNGQINSINLSLNMLENQIGQARKMREKNETLYKKLGIIFGVAICIILM